MLKKPVILSLLAALFLVLGACSNENGESADNTERTENTQENESMNHDEMNHGEMDHSSSGEVPEGLKVAENPTYEVGSQVILETDHMEGMKGAEATVAGAYDTVVYVVSYNPTNGGERVENHKWVIQEEIKEAGDEVLEPGTEVTLEADHMEGMKGGTAEIVSAEETTVYMVDYTSASTGEEVKNHQWVTESELSAAE